MAAALKLCILANGPSLADHDLSLVKTDVMGLNRSWQLYPEPRYHLTLELDHYKAHPKVYQRLASAGSLYVMGPWPVGHRIKIFEGNRKRTPFSKSEKDGAVESLDGIGSVFYVGLQLAYWKGYREVYALGLDLGGGHFHGEWETSPEIQRQNELFRHVPADMSVLTCGSPESVAIFPKVDFGAVCA